MAASYARSPSSPVRSKYSCAVSYDRIVAPVLGVAVLAPIPAYPASTPRGDDDGLPAGDTSGLVCISTGVPHGSVRSRSERPNLLALRRSGASLESLVDVEGTGDAEAAVAKVGMRVEGSGAETGVVRWLRALVRRWLIESVVSMELVVEEEEEEGTREWVS